MRKCSYSNEYGCPKYLTGYEHVNIYWILLFVLFLHHKFLYCYCEGYLAENLISTFITMWSLVYRQSSNALGQGVVIKVAGKIGIFIVFHTCLSKH